ncbi:hypothetical protein LZ32DRAFT_307415 [Colletotrichum eremochloae]|nr:hypothetical protein LZ32DRAFT_307415 [Colletotrichum eremochloae]
MLTSQTYSLFSNPGGRDVNSISVSTLSLCVFSLWHSLFSNLGGRDINTHPVDVSNFYSLFPTSGGRDVNSIDVSTLHSLFSTSGGRDINSIDVSTLHSLTSTLGGGNVTQLTSPDTFLSASFFIFPHSISGTDTSNHQRFSTLFESCPWQRQ